jgi:hypothetical protein
MKELIRWLGFVLLLCASRWLLSFTWPQSAFLAALCLEVSLLLTGDALKTGVNLAVLQLLLSSAVSAILGWAALLLYFLSYCQNGGTDCLAYSPTRRWIAFLLAPPIFIMQRWIFGTVDNVNNFDPVIYGRFGWIALWAYYLAITSGTIALVVRRRRKPHQESPPQ